MRRRHHSESGNEPQRTGPGPTISSNTDKPGGPSWANPSIESSRRLRNGARIWTFGCTILFANVLISIASAAIWPVFLQQENRLQQQANAQPTVDDALQSQPLFVPAPRNVTRPLQRARAAVEAGDYRLATELLGEILAAPDQSDYLHPVPEDPFRAASIHQQARMLMDQIPLAKRGDYVLRYKVMARQELEQAIENGNYSAISQVSRSYFHTEAGRQATYLMGYYLLELGQPMSASEQFLQLLNDPQGKAEFNPDLSIALATCHFVSGDLSSAERVLNQVAGEHPNETVRLGGQGYPLSEAKNSGLSWLSGIIGQQNLNSAPRPQHWAMIRGNVARNSQSGSGFPIPYPRWYVPTLNKTSHEEIAASRFRNRIDQSQVLIPSLQPLAVQDTVLVRSLDRVFGIDIQTGKRIWEYPAWSHARNSESLNESKPTRSSNEPLDRSSDLSADTKIKPWQVDQRLWQDHLYGQMASDGRRVFFVDRTGYAAELNRRIVGQRGITNENPDAGRSTNELVAVDVVRQGAFCWQVGGESGGQVPELAGAFFLGAPLVLDQELYVMAEHKSEILLVVLDALSGDLLWSRQLIAIDETPAVTEDRLRRLAAATPSCSNGILICPTSAFGVVAVDRASRTLLWGAQYPVPVSSNRSSNPRIRKALDAQRRNMAFTVSNDSLATIANGRVILAPMESDRIFCLDLLSGKQLWGPPEKSMLRSVAGNLLVKRPKTPASFPGKPIRDTLYVAGVYQNQVLLAGKGEFRALSLDSGKTMWSIDTAEFGQPVGHGFRVDSRYFLPMSNSQLVELDLQAQSVGKVVSTGRPLGNLACYKDQLISQGHDRISVFHQAEPVRRLVMEAYKRSDEKAVPREILLPQAQLLAMDGDSQAAINIANKAYQATNGTREKNLLMELILQQMKTDFVSVEKLVEKHKLELSRFNLLEFTAAYFDGLLEQGHLDRALSLLRPDVFQSIQQNAAVRELDQGAVQIRLDAMIRNRLRSLVDSTSPAQQSIHDWCRRMSAEMSHERLSLLADLLPAGSLPFDQLTRLARHHLQNRNFRQASQLLDTEHGLLAKSIPAEEWTEPRQAEIDALRIEMNRRAGWTKQANQMAIAFGKAYSNVRFIDPDSGHATTGEEFVRTLTEPLDEPSSVTLEGQWSDWKTGSVKAEISNARRNTTTRIRNVIRPKCIATTGDVIPGLVVQANIQSQNLELRDASGRLIGKVPYRTNIGGRTYYSRELYTGSYAIHGSLLVFAYGYDLLAVDLNQLRSGGDGRLWSRNLNRSRPPNTGGLIRPGFQNIRLRNPWGQNTVLLAEQNSGNPIGNFASNARFVYFRIGNVVHGVDARTGNTIWSRPNIKEKGWLVADEEHVGFLRATTDSLTSWTFDSATVLDAETGAWRFDVNLERFKSDALWNQNGMQLVFTNMDAEGQNLISYNLINQKETWTKQWPVGSRGLVRDPQTMVLLEPNSTLVYLDLRTGEIITSQSLTEQLTVHSFRVLPLLHHDLILINRTPPVPNSPQNEAQLTIRGGISGQSRLFNGWVYCLNQHDGKLEWSGPVRLEHFSFPRSQPLDSPLLTLHRIIFRTDVRRRDGQNMVQLHTLDLRNGQLVSLQKIKNWNLLSEQVETNLADQTVTCKFNDRELTLKIFDESSSQSTDKVDDSSPAVLTNETTFPEIILEFEATDSAQKRSKEQQELIKRALERKQR